MQSLQYVKVHPKTPPSMYSHEAEFQRISSNSRSIPWCFLVKESRVPIPFQEGGIRYITSIDNKKTYFELINKQRIGSGRLDE